MNERILELARQVWPDPNISHVNHMKFAELIVKECIEVVEDSQGYNQYFPHVTENIKQHFGVE
jgi:hypothetical protein